MRHTGHITSWDEEQGTGHIKMTNGLELILVHKHEFRNHQTPPQLNQEVSFILSKDNTGKFIAQNVLRYEDKLPSTSNIRVALIFSITALFLFSVMIFTKLPAEKAAIILVNYFLISTVTFKAYKIDRTFLLEHIGSLPESTLHFLSLLGGWPGAMLAQEILQHKIHDRGFKTLFWLTIFINIGLLAYLILQIK